MFFVHIHTFFDFLLPVSSNGVQEEEEEEGIVEEQGLRRKRGLETEGRVEGDGVDCANPICDSKDILVSGVCTQHQQTTLVHHFISLFEEK